MPQPLNPPAAARLDDLHTPLLVMVGELDDAATNDAMRHLARRVSGARLVTFPAAHMVNLEQPEPFNAVLGEFLVSGPQDQHERPPCNEPLPGDTPQFRCRCSR